MNELAKQRMDITQSFEDFERIMEDYFQVIPPDIDHFKTDIVTHWDYNDVEHSVTFYFDDDWKLQEFLDEMMECPAKDSFFEYEEYEHLDRVKNTITIIGREGGLY